MEPWRGLVPRQHSAAVEVAHEDDNVKIEVRRRRESWDHYSMELAAHDYDLARHSAQERKYCSLEAVRVYTCGGDSVC